MAEHMEKKIRLQSIGLDVIVPEDPNVGSLRPCKVAHRMFNDDPDQLLFRSIALALQHVGFESATAEALEAMRAQVETYVEHFLLKVTSSMMNSRRSLPTPLDFQYALDVFHLPIASIEPHLRPPIPGSKASIQLGTLPPSLLPASTNISLLGDDLEGASDKSARLYIPEQFPPFPSKHTYKWTEKESARERDPRRIREEASKAARQGEEALRRLTKVGKAGKEKDVKKSASKDPKSKERHQIWEKTMSAFLSADRETAGTNAVMAHGEADNWGTIVNAEQSFFRKGAPAKRKHSPVT